MNAAAFLVFAVVGVSAAAEPSTADFSFLVGEWRLEATQSPGTDRETQDLGTRVCRYELDGAYIRCESRVRRSNGSERRVVSLHNYNGIYGHHESLYYFSNWPVKPLARSTIMAAS